jgi:hypothetical protein
MSCTACACTAGLLNTGVACSPIMKGARSVILVPYYDSLGNQNSIDLSSATLTPAYFTALINQTDTSKRWYPLPALKNVEQKRADNIYEKFNDDSATFIREGIKSFKGLITGTYANPVLKGQIEAARCTQVGIYIVDFDGNLIGSLDSTGTLLYPIKLDEQSIAVRLAPGTDSTAQALELMFNVAVTELDENLRMISCNEMTINALNALIGTGLLDVKVSVTSITKTTFTAFFYTLFGTVKTPYPVTGLLVTDFVSSVTGTTSKLRDLTSSSDLTISSVTESAITKGSYACVYAGGVQNHYMTVTCKKNGFDFTSCSSTVFQDTLT